MHMLCLRVVGRVLGQCNSPLVVTKDHRGKGKGLSVWLRPGEEGVVLYDVLILKSW